MNDTLLDKFSGSFESKTIISTSNLMTIKFFSGGYSYDGRFSAQYTVSKSKSFFIKFSKNFTYKINFQNDIFR